MVDQTSYTLLSFETEETITFDGSIQLYPLLVVAFDDKLWQGKSFDTYRKEMSILKHAKIHNTSMDCSSCAAAEFLRYNKYGSSQEKNVFKIGNVSGPKFAFLYLEYTESFVPVVTSLVTRIVASKQVAIPSFSLSGAWFTSNGFLFEWYSNVMSRLAATGFTQAIQNYCRVWNPCVYLQDVLQKLKIIYNVTEFEISSMLEVSRCLRRALSGQTLDVANLNSQESKKAKPLAFHQIKGIFIITLFCLAANSIVYIFELMFSASLQPSFKTIELIKNIRSYITMCDLVEVEKIDTSL